MPKSPAQVDSNLPQLRPGEVVAGRFRIVEAIGSGGFSVVYRAHQKGMNRFVALKVLKPEASSDDKIVERFRREALFASQLSHPNTITLFDYGQTEGNLCYIAMEYLEGHDLSEELKYPRPMDLKRVWSILSQASRSLAEAHRMGLIHRDLKPENIFLVDRDGDEFVKVLDFGVSKALSSFQAPEQDSLAPLTQEGTVFGTPLYMAPEQAMAEEITPAVDVYALGHLAFEMITGRAKYADETSPMDVMLQQINDPPLRLPGDASDTPFDGLVYRTTLKDPGQRLADAGELLDELMSEPFLPYMDSTELPVRRQRSSNERPMLDLPVGDDQLDERRDTEKIYRWELSVLEETLEKVRESAEMRLVIIRGNPGTGRSNLLRAFLRRHRNEPGIRLVHRQAFLNGTTADAGLEADIAEAAGLALKGEGISEVSRLLGEALSEDNYPTLTDLTPVEIDSNPLSRLASRRDDFLTQLIEPFRRAARVGSLVWGIENLENVDPMTLAFLERFIRELRVHPAPILLAVTVHPDALVRRPGLMRYAENIINAPSTYARQLQLVDPEDELHGPDFDDAVEGLAEISSDVAADGSYSGKSVPKQPEFDDDELARWAALADGRPVDDAGDEEEADDETSADVLSGELQQQRRAEQIDTGPTQRLELFTTSEDIDAPRKRDAAPDIHQAFDLVLGYLAQLDERVIPRSLWEFIYPRVLPFETTRLMSVILEHAERFGILQLTDEAIGFTDREYAATIRETFEERDGAADDHAELAELLQKHYPNPRREDVRRIVHHSVKGGDYQRAIDLLLRVADDAYTDQDLDLAREYYLQFQSLIDDLSTRSAFSPVAVLPFPNEWLRLGEIQGALGEYGAAEDALNRSIREAPEDEHRVRATAHKLLGDLAMAQDRYEHARFCYETARDLFQQTSLARPYVASLAEIGRCSMLLGTPRRAEGVLLQALDKAHKLKDQPLCARLHRYLGEVLTRQARFRESIGHLDKALGLFDELDQHRNFVHCLDELGRAYYAAGEYPESRDHFTRALARLSTRRAQLDRSPHLGLACSLAALGQLEQAEVHLVEAMSHYSTRNQPANKARVQFHLGDLYLAMQRPAIADKHFERVYELGDRIGHRELAFDALIRCAYGRFDDGDRGGCFSLLSDAVDYADTIGSDSDRRFVARAHLIYLQLVIHDFQTEGETFSSLLAEVDETRIRPSHVLCDLFRADVAAARGGFREVASLLATALQNAAGLGEYGMFIPIARRERRLAQQTNELVSEHAAGGFAIGTLIPPEVGMRRR